jgi:hypothetical protein
MNFFGSSRWKKKSTHKKYVCGIFLYIRIFKIKSIDTKKPIPLYHLTDYDGKNDVVGGFYEFELTPVETKVFRIEKVLKKRVLKGKRQIYVKWKGFGNEHNSWIDETNIERTF